jgi:hypothetical protein
LAEALRGWPAQLDATGQGTPENLASGKKSSWTRRGLLAAGVLAAVLLAAFWTWRIQLTRPVPTEPAAVGPPRALPLEPAPKAQPLTIDLKVWKVVPAGFNNRVVGQLGQDVFRVHLKDVVRVEARLSEPAYAYFLLFNPGEEEGNRVQCFPSEERRPDKLRDVGPELDRYLVR